MDSDSESSSDHETRRPTRNKNFVSYFDDVPVELIQEIFNYIDKPKDFMNIKRVFIKCLPVMTVFKSYTFWRNKLYIEFPSIREIPLVYMSTGITFGNYLSMYRIVENRLKTIDKVTTSIYKQYTTTYLYKDINLHHLPIKFIDKGRLLYS